MPTTTNPFETQPADRMVLNTNDSKPSMPTSPSTQAEVKKAPQHEPISSSLSPSLLESDMNDFWDRSCPAGLIPGTSKQPSWDPAHGPHTWDIEEDFSMEGTEDIQKGPQLGDLRMMHVLPTIMSFLCKHDLVMMMAVNRAFYEEGKRLLYREVVWDLYDDTTNAMIMRFIKNSKLRFGTTLEPTFPATHVRHLYVHVGAQPPTATEYETQFRLGLLKLALPKLTELKKLSIADFRHDLIAGSNLFQIPQIHTLMDEIIYGEGTRKLETLEIVIHNDLTFFTVLRNDVTVERVDWEELLVEVPPTQRTRKTRGPSIKELIIKGTYPLEFPHRATFEFEFHLAYLLSTLSSSLTRLVLVGLPKPKYLACPRDVGTEAWGGSVGALMQTLGPDGLYNLEELTIEGADTRYKTAEDGILDWLRARSIYTSRSPPHISRRRRAQLDADELMRAKEPRETSTMKTAKTVFERRHLIEISLPIIDDPSSMPHLNCKESCHIHGTTSGKFTMNLAKQKTHQLHPNPLLRNKTAPRKFKHLHLINCPEPWPAFYEMGKVHPFTTIHFSAPWLDASSSNVPISLLKLGRPLTGFAPDPRSRKRIGLAPMWPDFNSNASNFYTAQDLLPDGSLTHEPSVLRIRPTGMSRINYRKLRKRLRGYFSILSENQFNDSTHPCQVVRKNPKHLEIRCLERLSNGFLEFVTETFGQDLEILGISRMNGLYMEESIRGHVRGWGKILKGCEKLKEFRIVWNLFDPLDRDEEQTWARPMRIGIGEKRRGGRELMMGFTEKEWWGEGVQLDKENISPTTAKEEEDLGNGEGPSTGSAHRNTEMDTPAGAVKYKTSPFPDANGRKWQKTLTELPQYRDYLSPGGVRQKDSPSKLKGPPKWNHQQRKDFLVFLLNWKLKSIYGDRKELLKDYLGTAEIEMNNSVPMPPIYNHHQKTPSSNHIPEDNGKTRDTLSTGLPGPSRSASPEYMCGIGDPSFYTPHMYYRISNSYFIQRSPLVSGEPTIYPISPAEYHNGLVYLNLVRAGCKERETLLAETLWNLMDARGSHEYFRLKSEFERDLLIHDRSQPADGFHYSPGIVLLNPDHTVYEHSEDCEPDYGIGIRGPWGRAFKEVLEERPRLFSTGFTGSESPLSRGHYMFSHTLQQFFEQINVWHEHLRVKKLLGQGVKRFCESAWVIFQEVPSLERIVGVLENGREVVAHVVRRSGESTLPGGGVEMIRLRCWSCGGGWVGDYNVKPKEGDDQGAPRRKVSFGDNARECRCLAMEM